VPALLAEDEARGKGGAFRFGQTIAVDLGIGNAGVWETLPDGGFVWRLRIASPGAHSLSLIFSEFRLAPGAELFVYDDDRSTVRGAYTAANQKEDGEFSIQPIGGDSVTLEYREPLAALGESALRVGGVVHDYRDVLAILRDSSGVSAASAACETDVNCPVGAPWVNQIRATIRLINGGLLCSGSLLNNTANDGKQYFITANHCGTLNNAIFQFKYQLSGCATGSAPTNFTVQGSVQKATSASIDYRLVEITSAIPLSYDAYYAGWDRSGIAPANTVTTHHPQGLPKKISFDYDAPGKTGSDWHIAQWDLGVTEPGSSGCPLYDPNGRFIGQLWGGQATCTFVFNDYYGRLDAEWSQVAAFLDPLATGASAIDGYDPSGGPALPPFIASLSPSSVTAFAPAQVTIGGTGFLTATQVTVASVPASFSIVSDTQIVLNVPTPSALGSVPVVVANAVGNSNAATLSYVETDPPMVATIPFHLSGTPLPVSWGGPVGDAYLYGLSLSPTTAPVLGFPLLLGLVPVSTGTLDALGYGPSGFTLAIPAGASGISIFHQVWTMDLATGIPSFRASGVVSTFLL
jgi:hypothetical protein